MIIKINLISMIQMGLYRGVGTTASIVVRVSVRVQVSGGSGGLEYKNQREETTVYSGSGQLVPYVQQLMILILKSIQNRGVTIGL
jgi:hypothetical protein